MRRRLNVINGVWGQDTVEDVWRAARKHWPDAKDTYEVTPYWKGG